MSMAPVKTPDDPTPAIARPTMSASLVGATAQINDPSSKMPSTIKKTHLMGKKVYSLPKNSWKEQLVRK